MNYQDLLSALGRKEEDAVFWHIDDRTKTKLTSNEVKEIARKNGEKNVPADEVVLPMYEFRADKLDLLKAKELHYGTYFCVNELGDRRSSKGNLRHDGNVTGFSACFADFDNAHTEEEFAAIREKIILSPIEVSAIVRTGHGYHAYWFLDGSSCPATVWNAVQLGIIDHFKSDTSIHDPSRILRLPGSWHCKDAELKLVTLEKCDAALRYSIEELATEFPYKEQQRMQKSNSVFSGTHPESTRYNSAQSFLGSSLQAFPEHQWEAKVWPQFLDWNKIHCTPPKTEAVIREQFDGFCKMHKRNNDIRSTGLTVFNAGDLIPEIVDVDNTVTVTLKDAGIDIRFTFSEVEQSKADCLNAVVSTEHIVPGSDPRPYTMRINLMSGSGCRDYATSLRSSFGKEPKWEILLNTATNKLREYLANKDMSIDLTTVDDREPPKFFHPFIVGNVPNLVFADGGTGKTKLCLRLALSLAFNIPFLGFTPSKQVKTLFVDYEDHQDEIAYTIKKLCQPQNMNLDVFSAKSSIIYFRPEGKPLYLIVPALKKLIAQHNIGLVLVDSAVPACGGEAEGSDGATRYYNALSQLSITSVTIAHITKNGDSKNEKAYGSVFWFNLFRNIWNLATSDDVSTFKPEGIDALRWTSTKNLVLYHKKCNRDALQRPIGFRMTFGEGIIRYDEIEYKPSSVTVPNRIIELLAQHGGLDKSALASLLRTEGGKSVADQTLKDTLTRMVLSQKLTKPSAKGGVYTLNSGRNLSGTTTDTTTDDTRRY